MQWSPLTDMYKCRVGMESDREQGHPIETTYPDLNNPRTVCPNGDQYFYPKRRALINGPFIKDVVMNDGFPDAILYLAPGFGPLIRDATKQALCIMYVFPRPPDPASVHLPDPAPPCQTLPPAPADNRLVFITHSLGANILLDTLCDLLPCQPLTPSFALSAPLLDTFAHSLPFYMLANQYVLLGLHNADPVRDMSRGSLDQIVDIRAHPFFLKLAAIRARRTNGYDRRGPGPSSPPLDIIAFSDPNDDLSFILPDFPNQPSPTPGSASPVTDTPVRVRNVLVTNAAELFWTFEDPATAHTGYATNPRKAGILDVIFCGMDNSKANTCSVKP